MITIDEDMGVKKIRSLYRALEKEFDAEDEIVIDFGMIPRIDLSVAQVIIVAGREARARGKAVRIRSLSEHVRSQLSLCGIKV